MRDINLEISSVYEANRSLEKEHNMEKYEERESEKYDEETAYRDKVWEANNDVKDEKYDGDHLTHKKQRRPFGAYTPSNEALRKMGQDEKYEKMHWDAMHE